MQLRAGLVYMVLFLVVAAGAYGVIATAEAPEVTIDEADADYQLETGDDFTVGETTYNVSELDGVTGTATLEYIDDEVVMEQTWEGASAADGDVWDAGDTLTFEEEGEEYHVYIYAPPEVEDEDDEADDDEADDDEADDDDANDEDEEEEEPQPETFLLVEAFDEEEYAVAERDDGVYVGIENEDGEEVLTHVNDVDEIDSIEHEVGDDIEFYEDDLGVVDAEITDLTTTTVTAEYLGEETETADLDHNEIAIIEGEEFAAYFPGGDRVYLTEDIESFEAQHDAVDAHNDRIHGLWWVIGLAVSTVLLLAAMAFMPTRG